MAGSGIKKALSSMYATNSIDKMLNGHAYARSVRAHTLLLRALSTHIFDAMDMNGGIYDFMDGYIEDIMNGKVSYENVVASSSVFGPFVDQFHKQLNECKARGSTAQLWVQYLEMVCIVHDFIHVEKTRNSTEHLKAVTKMLPYFRAAGHFPYAKSGHLYLQDMLAIEESMDQQTFEKFTEGFSTIRRSDEFNSGTWTDMIIEQTLMKSMKMEGGLSRGRSSKDSLLCKWVYGMHSMNAVCSELEKFCGMSLDNSEQHVDVRDSRIKRDEDDVLKLREWFKQHNSFPVTKQIMSLATGIVGHQEINCHNARNIGLRAMNNIIGQTFGDIKLKRSNKVFSLLCVNSSVKVYDAKVAVDPLLLFQRISVNKKFDEQLCDYFRYELSPYPISLFDNCGMRKTQKSALYQCLQPVDVQINSATVTYVIDGGFLLHRVVWQQNESFLQVINRYVAYIKKHFGATVVVVFDGYDDDSRNVKAMEQSRRTAMLSGSTEVSFDKNTQLSIPQDKFLSNRINKKKIIAMLMETFKGVNIVLKQARDDADVLIVETEIEESIINTTVMVGEDIDLLVVLMGRTQPEQKIFFMKPGKVKVKTVFYDVSALDKYPNSKSHILFLHAVTGCDTTGALFNKGKRNTLKLFNKRPDLHASADIFRKENQSQELVLSEGLRVLLAIYGAPKSENSLDSHRYLSFVKSTRFNRAVKLPSLPPTTAAAQQHLFRVYHQVQIWLGKDIEPQQWGWKVNHGLLEPITTLLPPAPDNLSRTIFCNCAKGCGTNCGCRKIGISCSSVCGHCHGLSCLNAAPEAPTIDAFDEGIDNNGVELLEMLGEDRSDDGELTNTTTYTDEEDTIQTQDIDDETRLVRRKKNAPCILPQRWCGNGHYASSIDIRRSIARKRFMRREKRIRPF